MNTGVLLLLTLFFSVMLFIVQRSEAKRRLLVIVLMLIPAELIRRYVFYVGRTPLTHPFIDLSDKVIFAHVVRNDIHREAWIALILALVLNFLFWLLIGRYNPLHSSDEIKVIGMDD